MYGQIKCLSPKIGLIHIIGIGGIGMSGLARILASHSFQLQGSDLVSNSCTEHLKTLGIKINIGHQKENIGDASLIVISSAVKENNPELQEAISRGIPIISRADLLREIMRPKYCISISGTHGKTTTTSLVAKMFEKAGQMPTVINGGIINEMGTNAYAGDGDILITEADESDKTFIKIPSHVAVITNIDHEHLDYYGTFENVKQAYKDFIENLPFYGFAVVCIDHPIVRELISNIKNRHIITYGESEDADIMAENIKTTEEGMQFDIKFNAKFHNLKVQHLKDIRLSIYGQHNVKNALAAIAIAIQKGFDLEVIRTAFDDFKGVKRRFITTGIIDGIRIIDDYAHHPVEITSTINTALEMLRNTNGQLIAVVEPHRYSRYKDLMESFKICFKGASRLIISDIYSGGEAPIAGITAANLISRIKEATEQEAIYLSDPALLPELVNSIAKAGDIVLHMGAGNITKWAYALPAALTKLRIT